MSDSYLAQWIAKINTGHVITEDDMATLARMRLALHSADKHHRQARAAQAETNRLATRVTWLENEIDHIDRVTNAAIAYKSAAARSDTAAASWAQQHLFDAVAVYLNGALDDDGTEP